MTNKDKIKQINLAERLKKSSFLNNFFWFFFFPFYPKSIGIPALYALICLVPQKILRINGNVPWPVHWTSRILYSNNIKIGKGSSPGLSGSNYIQARNGIEIGSNFRMGPNSSIVSANHDKDNYDKWEYSSPIIIGDNVLVGSNCFIGQGVKIGDNVVIGAHSNVVRDIPANSIAFGNPCKVVKAKKEYNGFDYSSIPDKVNHVSFLKLSFYLSLIFVFFFLYELDFTIISNIVNIEFVFLSIFFILLAFLFDTILWYRLLYQNDIDINFLKAFESTSKTIFTKYIPGKIAVLISRSSVVSKSTNTPNVDVVKLAFYYQILILIAGVFVGLSFVLNNLFEANLTMVIFSSVFLLLIIMLYSSFVISPNFSFSTNIISKQNIINVSLSLIFWLLLSVSFYFCFLSLDSNIDSFQTLMYPLALVIGIAVFISPGGFGIREGSLVYLLTLIDFSLEFSITVSIINRIFFLISECLFFLSSYAISYYFPPPR